MDHYAQVNNIRLHYLDYLAGQPPIALLHGLTANAHFFDGLIKAGLNQHHRIIIPDLRGRGSSDKPAAGYTMADHAADVLGLLEAVELKEVVIAGHSFGGLLALYITAHRPELVKKLILMDIAGEIRPDILEAIEPALSRLGRVVPSWEAYLEEMRRMPFLHDWWDPTIESYFRAELQFHRDGTVQTQSQREAMREAIKQALREPWAEYLSAVRRPTVLFHASGPYAGPGTPPLVSFEQAIATVNAIADARYVEVPGNHITMFFGEGARCLVEHIVDFVGK